MLIRSMIRHQVEDDADAAPMRLGNHAVEAGKRAEVAMHVAVVADVVTPIAQRRWIDRAQPERIDAELAQVIEMRGDAVEVADAVAIRVGKTARIDLIEDRVLPPMARHRLGGSVAHHLDEVIGVEALLRRLVYTDSRVFEPLERI